MIGPILIVITMLLALPIATMLGGAAWSALMGQALADDADLRHADAPK
ncbi:MAG: hypothetical protein RL531_1567 [Actinomycetota bacterium]|jgi:hypothetical protein